MRTEFQTHWKTNPTPLLLLRDHIDGLMQDCSNSSALAMGLLQSCTKPSTRYGCIPEQWEPLLLDQQWIQAMDKWSYPY